MLQVILCSLVLTMAFEWTRPADMLPTEPSDDFIHRKLLEIDPKGRYRHLWGQWRDQMLEGRDIFDGFFHRHRLIASVEPLPFAEVVAPECSAWVTQRYLIGGEVQEGRLVKSAYTKPFLVLEPSSGSIIYPSLNILGARILTESASPWGNQAPLVDVRGYCRGWVEWAQHCLLAHGDTLRGAGIYGAVYASLFNYPLPVSMLRAFCSSWCASTNTCFLRHGEITPTLWDMLHVAGLPIRGVMYDECIPDDVMLFGSDDRGEGHTPSSLSVLLKEYRRLAGESGRVSFDQWIRCFTLESHPWRSEYLPAGRELDSRYVVPSRGPSAVTDKTRLAAFLALWLCYQVMPSGRIGYIRSEVFLVASYLARGTTVSLAPAVLAHIYRGLRTLSSSDRPDLYDAVFPMHILGCWLSLHFEGLLTRVVPVRDAESLPLMCQFAGAFYGGVGEFKAHLAMRMSEQSPFKFVKQAVTRGLPSEDVECEDSSDLSLSPSQQDFLVSIRPGLLPSRNRSKCRFEPYSPHRVANQFGLDQSWPSYNLKDQMWKGDIAQARACWEDLLRLGTGSSFIMPSRSRAASCQISYEALAWYDHVLRSYWRCDIHH
nr:hypothetical protein [Serratia marcescens]